MEKCFKCSANKHDFKTDSRSSVMKKLDIWITVPVHAISAQNPILVH